MQVVQQIMQRLQVKILSTTNGAERGILEFSHLKSGTETVTGRWRDDSLQLLNSTNLSVAGNTTLTGNLTVGTAGTTITTTVGAAASVGIGTANPAYMLDVAGAINSSNDVKINGVSVADTALNDAVAMAIALG